MVSSLNKPGILLLWKNNKLDRPHNKALAHLDSSSELSIWILSLQMVTIQEYFLLVVTSRFRKSALQWFWPIINSKTLKWRRCVELDLFHDRDFRRRLRARGSVARHGGVYWNQTGCNFLLNKKATNGSTQLLFFCLNRFVKALSYCLLPVPFWLEEKLLSVVSVWSMQSEIWSERL